MQHHVLLLLFIITTDKLLALVQHQCGGDVQLDQKPSGHIALASLEAVTVSHRGSHQMDRLPAAPLCVWMLRLRPGQTVLLSLQRSESGPGVRVRCQGERGEQMLRAGQSPLLLRGCDGDRAVLTVAGPGRPNQTLLLSYYVQETERNSTGSGSGSDLSTAAAIPGPQTGSHVTTRAPAGPRQTQEALNQTSAPLLGPGAAASSDKEALLFPQEATDNGGETSAEGATASESTHSHTHTHIHTHAAPQHTGTPATDSAFGEGPRTHTSSPAPSSTLWRTWDTHGVLLLQDGGRRGNATPWRSERSTDGRGPHPSSAVTSNPLTSTSEARHGEADEPSASPSPSPSSSSGDPGASFGPEVKGHAASPHPESRTSTSDSPDELVNTATPTAHTPDLISSTTHTQTHLTHAQTHHTHAVPAAPTHTGLGSTQVTTSVYSDATWRTNAASSASSSSSTSSSTTVVAGEDGWTWRPGPSPPVTGNLGGNKSDWNNVDQTATDTHTHTPPPPTPFSLYTDSNTDTPSTPTPSSSLTHSATSEHAPRTYSTSPVSITTTLTLTSTAVSTHTPSVGLSGAVPMSTAPSPAAPERLHTSAAPSPSPSPYQPSTAGVTSDPRGVTPDPRGPTVTVKEYFTTSVAPPLPSRSTQHPPSTSPSAARSTPAHPSTTTSSQALKFYIVPDQPVAIKAEFIEALLQIIVEESESAATAAGLEEATAAWVEPYLQRAPGFRGVQGVWSSGCAVQALLEFKTSGALQWLGPEGPTSLLERTGLSQAVREGRAIRSSKIVNITVGGLQAGVCDWLLQCPAGYECVSQPGTANYSCSSVCHSDYCHHHGICTHHPAQLPVCRCLAGDDFWYMGQRCDVRMTRTRLVGACLAILLIVVTIIAVTALVAVRRYKAALIQAKVDQTRSSYRRFNHFDELSGRFWLRSWAGSADSMDNPAFTRSDELLHLRALDRPCCYHDDTLSLASTSPSHAAHVSTIYPHSSQYGWRGSEASVGEGVLDSGKASDLSVCSWPVEPIQWTPFPLLQQLALQRAPTVRVSRPRSYCEGMELVDIGKSWTA